MSDKKSPARPAATGPEGNVDQIRDILFGGQMRDYERRFQDMEERIRRESEKLRSDLLKRMDALETLLREQHEQVQATVQRHDRERREAHDELEQRLQTQGKSVRAELAALEQKHDQDAQQLRERIHRAGTDAGEALRERADELYAELQRMATQLRDDKVARQELAGFFSEMALRLNREFELPGSAPQTA